MKLSEIKKIVNAAKKQQFVSFDYEKDDGEKSHRVVRFGGHIEKKLEIKGTGSWMTGHGTGFRSMIVDRKGVKYLRGTDTKDSKHKIFKVSGISNIKC